MLIWLPLQHFSFLFENRAAKWLDQYFSKAILMAKVIINRIYQWEWTVMVSARKYSAEGVGHTAATGMAPIRMTERMRSAVQCNTWSWPACSISGAPLVTGETLKCLAWWENSLTSKFAVISPQIPLLFLFCLRLIISQLITPTITQNQSKGNTWYGTTAWQVLCVVATERAAGARYKPFNRSAPNRLLTEPERKQQDINFPLLQHLWFTI